MKHEVWLYNPAEPASCYYILLHSEMKKEAIKTSTELSEGDCDW